MHGEIFDLQWDAVDVQRRLITVTQSKSGRVRHIPMNDSTLDALWALKLPREGYVFNNKVTMSV